MSEDELRDLTDAALEGRLTPEDVARLERAVLADPAARAIYAEAAHQHAALFLLAGAAPPVVAPAPRRRRGLRAALLGGGLAAGLLLGSWLTAGRAPEPVAALTDAKGCRWEAGSLPTEVGTPLPPGRLRLAQGLARVAFASGAVVTLEGPAELELVDPMHCVLRAGQLVATVPEQANGFVVDTPSNRVTDFGTEFGVRVRDGRTADVQVFSGRVDVTNADSGKTRPVTTGGAFRFGPAGAEPLGADGPGPDGPPKPAGPGRVVPISTAQGRGKDAFVQQYTAAADRRHADETLHLKATAQRDSPWFRKAYLGFDLAGVAGRRVADAELSLTFAPTGMGFAALIGDATFGAYGLTSESGDAWSESPLAWDAAPANRPGAGLNPAATVRLGSLLLPQGTQSATLTLGGPALADFVRRDTNGMLTVIVVPETVGSGTSALVHGVASRRHPALPPPTLRLTLADEVQK